METELKLEFAAGDAAALAAAPVLRSGTDGGTRRLVSTYFDTEDGVLRKAGFTLRVRDDGATRRQTVKAEGAAAAGLFVRPEWERELAGDRPVIDAAAGPIAELVGTDALRPCFATEVTRAERTIERGGARIALALDTGAVRAGDRVRPLAELELELEDGPVAALFDLARALDEVAPLRLAVRSKSERGHRLARGEEEDALKAEPVALDRDGDAAEAFAAIVAACLRQFRANEALLLAGGEGATALHQARVGLRRLRSAFSLFAPLLAEDVAAARFAAELKELAAVLGHVRDLDVLLARPGGAAGERLAAARAEAFAIARGRLEAAATRRLMLDLAEWLAGGEWRAAAPARSEIVPFAAGLLDRRRRRVKRRGRHLAALDDEHRHRVRIEAKKLRYAAEFFAGLWRGKKARQRRADFAGAIEALQEELGELNDAAHGRAVLARLGLAGEAGPPVDVPRVLARAERAHEQLSEAKRFWR